MSVSANIIAYFSNAGFILTAPQPLQYTSQHGHPMYVDLRRLSQNSPAIVESKSKDVFVLIPLRVWIF